MLKQIREWKKQGWTHNSIAARLNTQGVPLPRRSESWNYENIEWLFKQRGSKPRLPIVAELHRLREAMLPIIYKDMRGNIVPDPRLNRKPNTDGQ